MFIRPFGGLYSACAIHVSCVVLAYGNQEYACEVCSAQLGRIVDLPFDPGIGYLNINTSFM